jgi:DeoR family fructose operon transcriptional repressor
MSAAPPLSGRQSTILGLLEHDQEVFVSRLATQLGVSEMTVRRDLRFLEELGHLARTHGGAVPRRVQPALAARLPAMAREKQAIGERAAALVAPGSHVFLGGSSTVAALADCMADRDALRITTTSIDIVQRVGRHDRHDVTLLGGTYRRQSATLIGPEMLESLDTRVFDACFVGTQAVHHEFGLLDVTEWHVAAIRKLRARSRRLIVLTDRSKFGSTSNFVAVPLAEIDVVVTDAEPPAPEVDALAQAGVEVIVASAP